MHHLQEEETKKINTSKKSKKEKKLKLLLFLVNVERECSSLASGTALTKLGIESKAKKNITTTLVLFCLKKKKKR